MSARYSLAREDGQKILKALLYSVASAGIVALMGLISTATVPPEFLFLVPLVNAVLVAIKKFVEEKYRE